VTEDSLLDLWRMAISVAAEVAAPFVICGLAVGLFVALLQTAMQLQESALTFVPKLGVALVVLAFGGHWMLDRLTGFTKAAFQSTSQPQALDDEPGLPEP
jgi:flagellar biosynthesis protein FliQ